MLSVASPQGKFIPVDGNIRADIILAEAGQATQTTSPTTTKYVTAKATSCSAISADIHHTKLVARNVPL